MMMMNSVGHGRGEREREQDKEQASVLSIGCWLLLGCGLCCVRRCCCDFRFSLYVIHNPSKIRTSILRDQNIESTAKNSVECILTIQTVHPICRPSVRHVCRFLRKSDPMPVLHVKCTDCRRKETTPNKLPIASRILRKVVGHKQSSVNQISIVSRNDEDPKNSFRIGFAID